MVPLSDGTRLAIIASRYQTDVIRYISTGTGKQLILMRDPRRLYIRFRPWSGTGMMTPYPGKIPDNASGIAIVQSPEVYMAKDSPGLVSGEWYVSSTDPLETIEIMTDTYIGR